MQSLIGWLKYLSSDWLDILKLKSNHTSKSTVDTSDGWSIYDNLISKQRKNVFDNIWDKSQGHH